MALFEKFGANSVAFIDFETTGLDPKDNYPTEIAIQKMGYSKLTGTPFIQNYQTLIKLPDGVELSSFIQELTGLTTEEVNSVGKPIEEVIPEIQRLLDNETMVVAQNANFDLGYLAIHFGIEPMLFMCTKTIEFLTAPHLSTKLSELHKRYAPDRTFEQTHRAMDDVQMLVDVFNGQIGIHGVDAMMFFVNKIAIQPDRPLIYTPQNAKILDFSAKYALKGGNK